MDKRHSKGQISKNAIHNYFLEQGYHCYLEDTTMPPFDMIVVNPETGLVRFIECKTENRRTDGTLITRPINAIQKSIENKTGFDIETVYYDVDTHNIRVQRKQKSRILNHMLLEELYASSR